MYDQAYEVKVGFFIKVVLCYCSDKLAGPPASLSIDFQGVNTGISNTF